jgi:hypothetical protein
MIPYGRSLALASAPPDAEHLKTSEDEVLEIKKKYRNQ